MCRQIRHRGPDDQGMYVKDYIGLGMRRSGNGCGVKQYLATDFVERLLISHMSGAADHGRKLWLLLMFAVWHQSYIE